MELAYLADPTGKPGEWIIMSRSGKVKFTFTDYQEAQDKFDELLSERTY